MSHLPCIEYYNSLKYLSVNICQFDIIDKRKMMEFLVVMNNKQPLTHLGLDLEAVNIFCIAE